MDWNRTRKAAKALDWSKRPAVESVPGKVGGAWVFRGTRMPVAAVIENLEDGLTIDEIVEMFDGLTREQVQAVPDFAAQSLEAPSRFRRCVCYSIKLHASPSGRLWPAISSKPREHKAGAAEQATLDVLLTIDRSLPREQNPEGRKTAVMILSKNRWSLVRPLIGQIVASVNAVKPGTFTVIEIPKK